MCREHVHRRLLSDGHAHAELHDWPRVCLLMEEERAARHAHGLSRARYRSSEAPRPDPISTTPHPQSILPKTATPGSGWTGGDRAMEGNMRHGSPSPAFHVSHSASARSLQTLTGRTIQRRSHSSPPNADEQWGAQHPSPKVGRTTNWSGPRVVGPSHGVNKYKECGGGR